MTDRESKRRPPDPQAAPKPESSGKPGPDASRCAGAGAGHNDRVDRNDAGTASITRSIQISEESDLYQDALQSAAVLKEKHAAFYNRDPKAFCTTVRKANGTAFRRKPGPAPDPRIVEAAAEHAAGAKWSDLYPKYI